MDKWRIFGDLVLTNDIVFIICQIERHIDVILASQPVIPRSLHTLTLGSRSFIVQQAWLTKSSLITPFILKIQSLSCLHPLGRPYVVVGPLGRCDWLQTSFSYNVNLTEKQRLLNWNPDGSLKTGMGAPSRRVPHKKKSRHRNNERVLEHVVFCLRKRQDWDYIVYLKF